MRVSTVAVFVLGLTSQAIGQGQPRAVQMPDTMGANFAIADSATGRAGPDDFDFLSGMWHFRFQQRNPDGTFAPPFTGHWRFERLRGTNLIEDHWRPDNPATSIHGGTRTYRVFNTRLKLWTMEGVNSVGEWAPGLMWVDGKDRLLIQHYGNVIMRFRYFAIEDNRFLWRADMSTDRGATWLRDRWTMEVTRIGR